MMFFHKTSALQTIIFDRLSHTPVLYGFKPMHIPLNARYFCRPDSFLWLRTPIDTRAGTSLICPES